MRKALGIALAALALLFLALFLSTDGAAKKAQAQQQEWAPDGGDAQTSFGIRSALLADSGNSTVAVLHLYLFPEGAEGVARIFCSELPIQKNMLLLSYASAPGISSGLGEKIAGELSSCGFSSREAGAQDAISSKNAVIISVAGAIPETLAENERKIAAQNSRVVSLESLPGRLIGADGAIAEANQSYGFALVQFSPGKDGVASHQAALEAILPAGAQAEAFAVTGGNHTFALEAAGTGTVFCRAVYLGKEGACRAADTYALERQAGELKGPTAILAGQSSNFEFSLGNGDEVGRNLSFRASLLDGRRVVLSQEIAGGKIMQGFASSFAITIPKGGRYVLAISDQFARQHAAAYVEAIGLEVRPVLKQGERYEFFATYGGKPVNGLVEAWIDSGGKKQYYATNGTLVVWAAPSAGSHTLHFACQGLEAEYAFASEGGGLAETYVRLGVPSFIFLLAVYLLLRAGRKPKYRITFPKAALRVHSQVFAESRQLVRAWEKADKRLGGFSLMASPEEIASSLSEVLGMGKGAEINAHSVRQALRKLVRVGVFAESEGMFAPASSLAGFSAGEVRTLRLIHDLLLEQGIPFRRARTMNVWGSDIELSLFSGKKMLLANMGKARRVAIFESSEALSSFERSLSEPSEENVRIRLAQANGKVIFACASRQEIESLLP